MQYQINYIHMINQTSIIFSQLDLHMEDSTISNILKSPIGPTLSKGFAALYRSQPQFPVSYLANWLLQQSKNQSARLHMKQDQHFKSQKSKQLQQIYRQKEQAIANRKVEPELAQKLQVLKTLMDNYEFKEDMLEEVLPEFIKEKEGVAASYIAELRFPMKKIGEEGEEQWVEDTQANKILKYVGASVSNKQLMIGQVLEQEKGGVSWGVVLKEEQQEEPVQQQNENGEPVPNTGPKNKLQKIYVPNVLKQPKMHYFRLPKLGSYVGFKWVIESYLVEEAFDKGGEKEKQHQQEIEALKKEHQETISDLKAELEEKESKQNYQQDQGYITMKQKLDQLEGKELALPQLKFPSLTKVFLVAADTLGDDSEISKEKQDNIQNILKYFKKEWEESERQSLVHDLQIYTNYQLSVDIDTEKIQQEMEQQGQSYTQKVVDKQIAEKDLKYEVEQVKFGLLKKYLLDKGKDYLKIYLTYNIGKFLNLLEDLLVFGEVEIPYDNEKGGQRKLSWRKIRVLVPQLTESILNKVEIVKNKIEESEEEALNKLISKFDKYDFDTIGTYNMGLWLLAQFVKKYVEMTLLACEIFKEKKQAFLRDRDSKIEEKDRILEEREKALEEHLAGLDEEEKEKFNEAEWFVNYDTDHPIPIIEDIPPEYADPKEEQQQQEEKKEEEKEQEKQKSNKEQKQQGQEQNQQNQEANQAENNEDKNQEEKPTSKQSNRRQQENLDEKQDEETPANQPQIETPAQPVNQAQQQ